VRAGLAGLPVAALAGLWRLGAGRVVVPEGVTMPDNPAAIPAASGNASPCSFIASSAASPRMPHDQQRHVRRSGSTWNEG
jgi:hypothetical protein